MKHISFILIYSLFASLLIGLQGCGTFNTGTGLPSDPSPQDLVDSELQSEITGVDFSKYKLKTLPEMETSYILPQTSPQGIIVMFHGTGGHGSNWVTQFEQSPSSPAEDMGKLEASLFSYQALEKGYIIIAPTSPNRISKKWAVSNNTSQASSDVIEVENLLEKIETTHSLPSLPVYALGMSNGGGFAPYASYWLNFDKAIVHSAKASVAKFSAYKTPTMWIYGANDSVVNTNEIPFIASTLAGRIGSQNTKVLSFKRQALTLEFFKYIDQDLHDRLLNVLKQKNLLDSNNKLNFQISPDPNDKFKIMGEKKRLLSEALNLDPELAPYESFLTERLLIADGEHRFTSDFANEVFSFL